LRKHFFEKMIQTTATLSLAAALAVGMTSCANNKTPNGEMTESLGTIGKEPAAQTEHTTMTTVQTENTAETTVRVEHTTGEPTQTEHTTAAAETTGEIGIEHPMRATTKEGLSIYLNADGKSYSVQFGDTAAGHLVIPTTYDGLPITGIGGNAFWRNEKLVSVTIPDSIKWIGSNAFGGCSALETVIMADSVTTLGGGAFGGCRKLSDVRLSECLERIEADTFSYSGLAHITIPNSVLGIGENAFFECDKLTGITLSNRLVRIEKGAFYKSGLVSLTIPGSVTEVGDSSFGYCGSLKRVVIDNGVAGIGDGAFRGCAALGEVELPQSLGYIKSFAFFECFALRSITIGSGVMDIDRTAFGCCGALESIAVAVGNPVYHSAGNCLIETKSGRLITGCRNSVIPADGSVKIISMYAFYLGGDMTDITFGGTRAEWEAMQKDMMWDSMSGDYTVHCTDGDIRKSE